MDLKNYKIEMSSPLLYFLQKMVFLSRKYLENEDFLPMFCFQRTNILMIISLSSSMLVCLGISLGTSVEIDTITSRCDFHT